MKYEQELILLTEGEAFSSFGKVKNTPWYVLIDYCKMVKQNVPGGGLFFSHFGTIYV